MLPTLKPRAPPVLKYCTIEPMLQRLVVEQSLLRDIDSA
jgi:hypothetical protein